MTRRRLTGLLTAAASLLLALGTAAPTQAQDNYWTRFNYYPYYYFPHNYWPSQGPRWPEPPGARYLPPPAYMAFPPFRESGWRYELWQPMPYYRGSHFWLDQF